jgi:hypothetical protein
LEKSTRRIRHFLPRPLERERSPPVCAWRTSAPSEHHSTARTLTPSYHNDNYNSSSLSTVIRDLASPSPSPPRAPLPPLRTGSTARLKHNGINTTANVAPRANTPYTHARSTARQLRAIPHSPVKAKHCAKQPLRLSSLQPPTQSAPSTCDHPTNHWQESSLCQHTSHIPTLITSFAAPTTSFAQDTAEDACQPRIGRRAQRLRQHFTPPIANATFFASHPE